MGDGLLIINDTSKLQIDSTYKNMSLIGKSSGNLFQHTLNNIHAFKAPDNTSFSIRSYSDNSVDCYYELTTEVTSYDFGWTSIPSSNGVGIEIYNPNSELVFSNQSKSLRILDFVSMNIANISGDAIFTKNYTGKTIAIIPSQIPYNWERNNQNIRGYSTIFTINGSSLSVTYGIAKEWYAYKGSITGSAARNDVFQPYVNFLVIDVSNY